MRRLSRWLLLIAALLAAPSAAVAQGDVPPSFFTGPLSHPNYATGGLYVAIQFSYMKTNRPLANQPIAYRGFFDLDGALGTQYAFVGSGDEAVNTSQVMGPGNWQPGWDLFVGYRFNGGIVLEAQWKHLVQARYTYMASLIPPNLNVGPQFENTFLTAFVTNFPTDFAGNAQNIPNGTNATTFGIWNAASLMQISYIQRFDIYGLNVRIPIWETESYRHYGIVGPQSVWIFDRFVWRTVDQDLNGAAAPETTANYSNTISNRLLGVRFGSGHDWFFGVTPVGGFSGMIELDGGLFLDVAKTKVAWEREDGGYSVTRGRRFYPLVPAGEFHVGLAWYPWEAICIQGGYDFQAYFNTISSPRPVDFNVGTVDPEFRNEFIRFYHGFRFGISFVF